MSESAALDLRVPIGGLFTGLGVLIGGYGLATHGDAAIYAKSLGININLWWGIIMLVIGVILLVLGMRAEKEHHPSGAVETELSPEGRATERREHRTGLER
jgi:membrane protein implicated in regulation of membrane protease activity